MQLIQTVCCFAYIVLSMGRVGMATAKEVDIETLPDRMREEAVTLKTTLIAPLFIGAWVRKA